VRYAPNQTPDNVQGNEFFGSEFYRIKEALRNLEVDGLTVYKGSPAKVAFVVNDSGIGVYDTVGANPIIELFNNTPLRTGFLRFTDTVGTLEQTNSNSGQLVFTAKDAGGAAQSLVWQAVNGILTAFAKEALRTSDTFLRLNQNGDFTGGVFSPGVLRADGGLQTVLIARADGGVDLGNAVGRLRLGATRGSINTIDAIGGWYGYQCNARVAFLHDGVTAFEIRDLVNTKILFGATLGAESSMYQNNVQTAKTAVSDFQVHDGTAFRSVFKGQKFKSAQQTNATFGSVAHGFGALPTFYQVVLVCITTEKSYAVGDEVDLLSAEGSSGQFPAVWADATNVGWAMVQTNPFINTKGSAVNSAITAANWKIVVKAWLWQ